MSHAVVVVAEIRCDLALVEEKIIALGQLQHFLQESRGDSPFGRYQKVVVDQAHHEVQG